MKSAPFSLAMILLASAAWIAVAGGTDQPQPLNKFRPQWQTGQQWMVETESLQPQMALPTQHALTTRWQFDVEAVDQLDGVPCWRIVARIVQDGLRLDEPRTTIWVDQSAATIHQIDIQLPTPDGYRLVTESYSSGPRPAPVIGLPSVLPIALPQFPPRGTKATDTFQYALASGPAGVKAVNEVGFVTSVRQELTEPSEAGLKSIFGEPEIKHLESQSLIEVKLATPEQTVRQIWREGSPWPLYADNGMTKMRLVEATKRHLPRGAEQDQEARESAVPNSEQAPSETPEGEPVERDTVERATDELPRSEVEPVEATKTLVIADGVEKAAARITPWSGYWWPIRDGRLLVPLTKYDLLTQHQAAEWERLHFPPGPEVPAWHGYCHAWAAASILEPEPDLVRSPGTSDLQVLLDIGDQKGLLTACHTEDLANSWGTRNEAGDSVEDGLDLPPDLLWRLLKLHVGEADVPLILDIEPGGEVWNYPVYQYEVRYHPLDARDQFEGEMTLLMADNAVPPEFQGTKPRKQTYQFTFAMRGGNLIMGSGRWTGPSLQDHPDFAWYPYRAAATNPEVFHHKVRQLVSDHQIPPAASPVSPQPETPEVTTESGTPEATVAETDTAEATERSERPSQPAENQGRPDPLIVSPWELVALIASQTSSFSFDATVDRFDGASYQPGEHFFLRVTSDQPGYFYLLQVDHSGVPTLRYPTAGEDNRIPGGRTVEIRPAGAEEGFAVVGPAGTLRLKSIVTSRPLAFSGSMEPLQSADANQAHQHAGLPVPFRWHPAQRKQIKERLNDRQLDRARAEPALPPREVLGPFAQDLTVIYVDVPSR